MRHLVDQYGADSTRVSLRANRKQKETMSGPVLGREHQIQSESKPEAARENEWTSMWQTAPELV
jgi:hypothetical protein